MLAKILIELFVEERSWWHDSAMHIWHCTPGMWSTSSSSSPRSPKSGMTLRTLVMPKGPNGGQRRRQGTDSECLEITISSNLSFVYLLSFVRFRGAFSNCSQAEVLVETKREKLQYLRGSANCCQVGRPFIERRMCEYAEKVRELPTRVPPPPLHGKFHFKFPICFSDELP